MLVVDKDEKAVSDAAKKKTEFNTFEDIEDLVARPPVGGGWLQGLKLAHGAGSVGGCGCS